MAQWFGPKRIGYGISPRGWQGWLATLVLLAGVISSRVLRPESFGLPHWLKSAVPGGLLLAYVVLIAFTYRPDE